MPPKQSKVDETKRKVLQSLAEMHALGITCPTVKFLGLALGFTNIGGHSFSYARSQLKEDNLVVSKSSGTISITEPGIASVSRVSPPKTNQELHKRIITTLCKHKTFPREDKAMRLLQVLADGKERSKDEIAQICGYANMKSGGACGFFARMSEFKLMCDGKKSGTVKLIDGMFPYGRPSMQQQQQPPIAHKRATSSSQQQQLSDSKELVSPKQGPEVKTGATVSQKHQKHQTAPLKSPPLPKEKPVEDKATVAASRPSDSDLKEARHNEKRRLLHEEKPRKKHKAASTIDETPLKESSEKLPGEKQRSKNITEKVVDNILVERNTQKDPNLDLVEAVRRDIMRGIAEMKSTVGATSISVIYAAISAGYIDTSYATFQKALSQLAELDLGKVEGETLHLTKAGIAACPTVEPLKSNKALQDKVFEVFFKATSGMPTRGSSLNMFSLLGTGGSYTLQEVAEIGHYPYIRMPTFVKFIRRLQSMKLLEHDRKRYQFAMVMFPFGRKPMDTAKGF